MSTRKHVSVDGRELTVSNLSKVFFPENGLTKGEVIAFYSQIAEMILPHLKDRPLTLKRYPDGIEGEHFYEKNAPSHIPAMGEALCGSPKRRWTGHSVRSLQRCGHPHLGD